MRVLLALLISLCPSLANQSFLLDPKGAVGFSQLPTEESAPADHTHAVDPMQRQDIAQNKSSSIERNQPTIQTEVSPDRVSIFRKSSALGFDCLGYGYMRMEFSTGSGPNIVNWMPIDGMLSATRKHYINPLLPTSVARTIQILLQAKILHHAPPNRYWSFRRERQ